MYLEFNRIEWLFTPHRIIWNPVKLIEFLGDVQKSGVLPGVRSYPLFPVIINFDVWSVWSRNQDWCDLFSEKTTWQFLFFVYLSTFGAFCISDRNTELSSVPQPRLRLWDGVNSVLLQLRTSLICYKSCYSPNQSLMCQCDSLYYLEMVSLHRISISACSLRG